MANSMLRFAAPNQRTPKGYFLFFSQREIWERFYNSKLNSHVDILRIELEKSNTRKSITNNLNVIVNIIRLGNIITLDWKKSTKALNEARTSTSRAFQNVKGLALLTAQFKSASMETKKQNLLGAFPPS